VPLNHRPHRLVQAATGAATPISTSTRLNSRGEADDPKFTISPRFGGAFLVRSVIGALPKTLSLYVQASKMVLWHLILSSVTLHICKTPASHLFTV